MSQKIVFTKLTFIAVILLSATAFVSCEKYVWEKAPIIPIDPEVPISFQTDIIPIFTGNSCLDCHAGFKDPDLRPANAYNAITTGGYIDLINPESSRIYAHLLTSPHSTRCSDTDRQMILAWIKKGALNN